MVLKRLLVRICICRQRSHLSPQMWLLLRGP